MKIKEAQKAVREYNRKQHEVWVAKHTEKIKKLSGKCYNTFPHQRYTKILDVTNDKIVYQELEFYKDSDATIKLSHDKLRNKYNEEPFIITQILEMPDRMRRVSQKKYDEVYVDVLKALGLRESHSTSN